MASDPTTRARERFSDWMTTLADLQGTIRLLDWDRETTMPAGAAETRGRHVTTLSALHHRELLRDGIDDDIATLEEHGNLTEADRATFRLARRERQRAMRIPEQLVRQRAEVTSRGVTAWLAARQSGSFAEFAPDLERVVATMRRVGEAVEVGSEPYDGLLDRFEPGMQVAQLETLFADLTPRLAANLSAAGNCPGARGLADRTWPDAAQMAVANDIARLVGFNLDEVVIAISAHPFTDSPHRGDVRFSTRLNPGDPTGNVMTVLHEAGHAMYAQGLPNEHDATFVFATPSLAADESQSRFFENHLGRRLAFWRHIHPILTERFGASLDGFSADDLHNHVTRIVPGWCRVDADEVTYDLHIAVRFELELALIRGELAVGDLPGAWTERMEALLGVTPVDDREGCMQDIHWAWGLIGYFPTYTLGNIYAAQLTAALEREHGELDMLIQDGAFDMILAFMRDRVHRHGSLFETSELMERAAGTPFSVQPFLDRLQSLANL